MNRRSSTKIPKKKNKRTPLKKLFLAALVKNMWNITLAAREVGIDRTTYYLWLKSDPKFAETIRETEEAEIDFVEAALKSQIRAGNHISTIFYLKCKAKSRGYIERQEITGKDGAPLSGIGDVTRLTDDELTILHSLLEKAQARE